MSSAFCDVKYLLKMKRGLTFYTKTIHSKNNEYTFDTMATENVLIRKYLNTPKMQNKRPQKLFP